MYTITFQQGKKLIKMSFEAQTMSEAIIFYNNFFPMSSLICARRG